LAASSAAASSILDSISRTLVVLGWPLRRPLPAGTDGSNDVSLSPAFSLDGTRLAFLSAGTDLGPADTNIFPVRPGTEPECIDVYVRHLPSGTTSLASTADGDSLPYADSTGVAFAPGDGTTIAFTTSSRPGFVNSIHLATLVPPPDEGG
jgi:hypothetical protein